MSEARGKAGKALPSISHLEHLAEAMKTAYSPPMRAAINQANTMVTALGPPAPWPDVAEHKGYRFFRRRPSQLEATYYDAWDGGTKVLTVWIRDRDFVDGGLWADTDVRVEFPGQRPTELFGNVVAYLEANQEPV